jgi:hypothetical protein
MILGLRGKSRDKSQMLKVSCAGTFGGKPVLKFNPVAWIIFVSIWPNYVHN